MINRILLCSDLDRTILPNGAQDESPGARELLHAVSGRPEVTLVYVSGRHLGLLKSAIEEYGIPVPDFAVGDVGATIYQITEGQWGSWTEWEKQIAPDWKGCTHDRIAGLFRDMDELELQEPSKQNKFKLSYYAAEDTDHRKLVEKMQKRLHPEGIRSSLIWSVDEEKHKGLLDVLPENATKYHAIRFIMQSRDFTEKQTVFAGDSGNDLPVLTSGLQSVLVRNASPDVRAEAEKVTRDKGIQDMLYFAGGGFLGMNGNYSAGVLEGLAHFIPEAESWLSINMFRKI